MLLHCREHHGVAVMALCSANLENEPSMCDVRNQMPCQEVQKLSPQLGFIQLLQEPGHSLLPQVGNLPGLKASSLQSRTPPALHLYCLAVKT